VVVLFYEFQFLNAMLCSLAQSDIGCSIICRLNCVLFWWGSYMKEEIIFFAYVFFLTLPGIVENIYGAH